MGIFKGRLKSAVKRTASNVKSKTQNFIQKAKDAGGFALLIPFKNLMVNALRARGIRHGSSLSDIATSFFQNIVRRNSFDENGAFGHDDLFLVSTEYATLPDDVTKVDSLEPATITVIVTAIVKYIKTIKDRKEANEPLTPLQEKVAVAAEKVNEVKDSEIRAATNEEVGSIVNDNAHIIVGVLVLGFLLLMYRAK